MPGMSEREKNGSVGEVARNSTCSASVVEITAGTLLTRYCLRTADHRAAKWTGTILPSQEGTWEGWILGQPPGSLRKERPHLTNLC
jgi:hypothetical protein